MWQKCKSRALSREREEMELSRVPGDSPGISRTAPVLGAEFGGWEFIPGGFQGEETIPESSPAERGPSNFEKRHSQSFPRIEFLTNPGGFPHF